MQETPSTAAPPSRLTCILDPALALTPQGILLAKHFHRWVNLWLVPEFRHVIQNSRVYQARPGLWMAERQPLESEVGHRALARQQHRSLLAWEQHLGRHDLLNLGLFWLGDRLQESLLPPDQSPQLLRQWERLTEAFDRHYSQAPPDQQTRLNPVRPTTLLKQGFRDVVTLAALLESALVLTLQSTVEAQASPIICQQLEQWHISCAALPADHPSVAWERQFLVKLLTEAGLSPLLWESPSLAVLHILAPYLGLATIPESATSDAADIEVVSSPAFRKPDFWAETKAFWYLLN